MNESYYTWREWLSEIGESADRILPPWRIILAAALVLAIFLVMVGNSNADDPMPAGIWNCDSQGNCVSMSGIERDDDKTVADAVIYYRGASHRGKLVRDCSTGRTTTRGIPGLAEDWPLPGPGYETRGGAFSWLCSESENP